MKKLIIYFLLILALPASSFGQPVTVGSSSPDYGTLLDAFAAINAGDLQGDVVLQIIDNTLEYGTAVLYHFRGC
jgi:hypothetical protein